VSAGRASDARHWGPVALLATLYLSQGLPFGFFTLAVPAVLREQGQSLQVVGLSSALALPWALKFLWSPAIDRFGRRKEWIVPLQGATVAVLAGLAWVDPGTAGAAWLAAGMVAASLLAATQDVATDGLAVRILTPEARGLGNGVQVAGYRLGMIVGGSAVLVLFARAGWSWAFLAMAAALALLTVPIARYPEAPARPVDASPLDLWGSVRALGPRWMLVLATYKLGESAAGAMLRPLLVDRGWALDELGMLLGVGASAMGLIGALLGGVLAGRFRRRSLVVLAVVQGVAVLAQAAAVSAGGLVAALLVEHVASGMATAALFTSMMDRCRRRLEATDYTLQASVVVISSGIGASLSGLSAHELGYAGHFAASAAVCGLGAMAAGWALREGR